ncbi:hypothetical protein ACWEHT_26325 [Streptomyces sp. NPDC004646]
MTTQPPPPEAGDVRFTATTVEYFDGSDWVEHEELPDDQLPPQLRGHTDDEDDEGPDDLPFPE